jgi:GNAT superfamily N-acetyltransferase
MSDPFALAPPPPGIALRTDLRPGDLGSVVRLHGVVYGHEYGFDPTFEAYVAAPLAECVLAASPRERLWLAKRGDELVGCVAIVAATPVEAQLRWFLVAPPARGAGLGKALLGEALAFARGAGYRTVGLWTVSALAAAARLYQSAGFILAEERPGQRWGVDVVEQRYELTLPPAGGGTPSSPRTSQSH